MFGRPFMGGLERKGIIATGTPTEIAPTAVENCASGEQDSSWAPTAQFLGVPTGITCGSRLRRRITIASVHAQEREANMTTAIWWVRRDLRLHDNDALRAALAAQRPALIPVFVLDPALLAAPDAGEKRVAFLFGGLRAWMSTCALAAAGSSSAAAIRWPSWRNS